MYNTCLLMLLFPLLSPGMSGNVGRGIKSSNSDFHKIGGVIKKPARLGRF